MNRVGKNSSRISGTSFTGENVLECILFAQIRISEFTSSQSNQPLASVYNVVSPR